MDISFEKMYSSTMSRWIGSLLFFLVLLPWGLSAHPHEWVDWGVGLVLHESKPARAVSLQLEMTWDEWLSALILTDFPRISQNTLSPADLKQLDVTYGLASDQRAVNIVVTYRGKPVPVKPVILPPRTNGKTVTLVYSLPLGLKVETPSALTISVYDPTYYTDMGIRSKVGAFFLGVKDPGAYQGSFAYEQDFAHPYYGGSVFPEVVVFSLKP